MGKRGGVSNTMNFKVKLLFFPLLINNKVVLKGGLNFLITPISVPLFPWHNLRSIVIQPPEVSYAIKISYVLVTLLPLKFNLLHFCRQ